MTNFTDELINEYDVYSDITNYINISDADRLTAKKAFKDALKVSFDPRTRASLRTGVIDVVNFHKAYDKELAELGLLKVLFGADGKLLNAGTYGKIKDIDKTKYPDLAKDLSNFWGAQFKDHLDTKESTMKATAEIGQKEEAQNKTEEEHTKIKSEVEQATTDLVNKLSADLDIVDLLDKLNYDDEVYRLEGKSEVYQDLITYTHDWKVEIAIKLKNLVDNSYYNIYSFRLTRRDPMQLKDFVEAYGYEDIRHGVLSNLSRYYKGIKLTVDRKNIIKKVTGKEEKYFNSNAEVVLRDSTDNKYILDILPDGHSYGAASNAVARSVYFTDLSGTDITISEISEKELPLEIVAINFKDYYEHNIHSVYGHSTRTNTICLSNKADEDVYSYFKLVRKAGDLEVLDRDNSPLTDMTSNIEYNKSVNGVTYPVVVTIQLISYND